MKDPWFANIGQIVQIVFALIAVIFAGIGAWPRMAGSQFFSLGAVLFYLLVALVIFSVYSFLRTFAASKQPPLAPALPEASSTLNKLLETAPKIQVSYKTGQIGTLTLKSDREVTIFGAVKLHSEERYDSEYAFSLVPGLPLVVDAGSPVESKEYGLIDSRNPTTSSNLGEVMAGSTPRSSDEVVLDYRDRSGNEFSQRFVLYRNLDGSVVWVPDPVSLGGKSRSPVPEAQDLADLRRKLADAAKYPQTRKEWQEVLNENREIKAKAPGLLLAGRLLLLAEDALSLFHSFKLIMTEFPVSSLDTSHPLSRSVIFMDPSEEGQPILPQRRRLMSFRDRYSTHRSHVEQLGTIEGFKSVLDALPTEREAGQIAEMLYNHEHALRAKVRQLAAGYELSSGTTL